MRPKQGASTRLAMLAALPLLLVSGLALLPTGCSSSSKKGGDDNGPIKLKVAYLGLT